MQRKHAKLSASESHRWFKCPGSVRVCQGLPNKSGVAAIRGTAAHHLGALIISKDPIIERMRAGRDHYLWLIGWEFEFENDGEMLKAIVDEKMLDGVMIYVEHVERLRADFHGAQIYVEKKLSMEHVWPNMFGTGDLVIDDIFDLIVTDYKNGFIPVILIEPGYDPLKPDLKLLNSQLLMYAVGAAHLFGWVHANVTIQIVQPNCISVKNVQTITIPIELLKEWEESDLYEAAVATEAANAPLVAGAWCIWCPARKRCPELNARMEEIALADFDDIDEEPSPRKLLGDDHILSVLRWASVLEKLIGDAKAHAFAKLESGEDVDGYKLVRSNPHRRWPESVIDSTKLMKRLREAGASIENPDSLYNVDLKSPSQVEKLLGGKKEAKEIVKQVAVKPAGELTLSPISDPRSAVMGADEFEGVEDEV